MNLRKRLAIVMAALVLSGGLMAIFATPQQTPVAKAGLWCGQSCTNFVVPTPLPTE